MKDIAWQVEIYQHYCSGVDAEGSFDNEALILVLDVTADTAQEASNKGWEYINQTKIPDAEVRRVSRVHLEPVAFTPTLRKGSLKEYVEDQRRSPGKPATIARPDCLGEANCRPSI